ncbi:hypothetical protein SBA4_2430003 [Candidatus Sulfopaludibacter sp. SbA4]|nr:hypothetical protein SBA4_2430003 [Candidatus Sulfopaludibacter sp. SbA4]
MHTNPYSRLLDIVQTGGTFTASDGQAFFRLPERAPSRPSPRRVAAPKPSSSKPSTRLGQPSSEPSAPPSLAPWRAARPSVACPQ